MLSGQCIIPLQCTREMLLTFRWRSCPCLWCRCGDQSPPSIRIVQSRVVCIECIVCIIEVSIQLYKVVQQRMYATQYVYDIGQVSVLYYRSGQCSIGSIWPYGAPCTIEYYYCIYSVLYYYNLCRNSHQPDRFLHITNIVYIIVFINYIW